VIFHTTALGESKISNFLVTAITHRPLQSAVTERMLEVNHHILTLRTKRTMLQHVDHSTLVPRLSNIINEYLNCSSSKVGYFYTFER
jgi:hypothetical protein